MLHLRRQAEGREPRNPLRKQADRRRGAAALAVQVDAKASDPLHQEGGVGDAVIAVQPPRVRRERRQHRFLDLDAVERPFVEGKHASIDADGRRRTGHQEQIAPVLLRDAAQPSLEPRRGACRSRDVQHGRRRVQLADQFVEVVGIVHRGAPFRPGESGASAK